MFKGLKILVSRNGTQRDRSELQKLIGDEELLVLGLVLENSCLHFQEVCNQTDISGVSVSGSTICCLL